MLNSQYPVRVEADHIFDGCLVLARHPVSAERAATGPASFAQWMAYPVRKL